MSRKVNVNVKVYKAYYYESPFEETKCFTTSDFKTGETEFNGFRKALSIPAENVVSKGTEVVKYEVDVDTIIQVGTPVDTKLETPTPEEIDMNVEQIFTPDKEVK